MSYVALYRKYRPNNFANVVGQDTVVKILINSIKTNHISKILSAINEWKLYTKDGVTIRYVISGIRRTNRSVRSKK